ncbi:pheromone precursor [Trametes coccinea BRFM310]|uniref:Pheromone n=1 Tax=Trametes coccinea (strain BRFM310) TaxID=1353009 RepID=A0A1Y2IRY4_TRAC3|nr:pheromone precursor [Trametes coccinea BRFM310]
MDAFFVIAAPVPAEDPASSPDGDILFADQDRLGTLGTHGTCVIA